MNNTTFKDLSQFHNENEKFIKIYRFFCEIKDSRSSKSPPDYCTKNLIDLFTGEEVVHYFIRESTRGLITDFSRKSRNRLLKNTLSLEYTPRVFITLTYPTFYPADSSEWKRHLDNFSRELRRQYPDSYFIWKLEPQKRGAPHFHLLGDIFNQELDKDFYNVVSRLWCRVVGTTGENRRKHEQAGTRVDFLEHNDSNKKIFSYVSKYIGKPINGEDLPGWSRPGRFWGVINKSSMPGKEVLNIKLDDNEIVLIKRLAKKWVRKIKQSKKCDKIFDLNKSFTAFFNDSTIIRLLTYLKGKFVGYHSEFGVVDHNLCNFYYYNGG